MRGFRRKNRDLRSSRLKTYNPVLATNDAVVETMSTNPLPASALSSIVISTYALGGFLLWWTSARFSSEDQQLSSLIGFLIVSAIAFVQLFAWQSAILLIRESRARKKINFSNLLRRSTKRFGSFFAVFVLVSLVLAAFALLLLKATDPFSIRIQASIWLFALSAFMSVVAVKTVLIFYVMSYENKPFLGAINRGMMLSRGHFFEILGTLLVQLATAGISFSSLVHQVGGIDTRFHQYTSIESTNKKSPKTGHWLNLLATLLWLAIISVLAVAAYNRAAGPVDSVGIPERTRRQADNFCYFSSAGESFVCSQDRQTCMQQEECRTTLEARDEINELLKSTAY